METLRAGVFQGALPCQVIAFIHDAAQGNGRLLHCPDIAGDAHQDQPVPRDAQQSIGQRAFKRDPMRELTTAS